MNSLHKISLSIYDKVSAIMSEACNAVRRELSLKLMELKLQGL